MALTIFSFYAWTSLWSVPQFPCVSKGFVSKSFKDISKKHKSGDLDILGNVLFYQVKLLESNRNKAHSTYYHLYFTNRKGVLMPKKAGVGGGEGRGQSQDYF